MFTHRIIRTRYQMRPRSAYGIILFLGFSATGVASAWVAPTFIQVQADECAASATPGRSIPVYRSASDTWVWPRSIQAEQSVPANVQRAPRAIPHVPEGVLASSWTFAANVRPHPETSGQHLWPDIAALPSGRVGVAWMDDHASGGYHIFYSESPDGGATWSAPSRIDDRTAGAYSKFVSLAFTPAGNPVAVWEDDRSGAINLYFSRRDPVNGWTPNVRVNSTGGSPSGSDFMNGSIAVLDDNRYFVAWTDWREGAFNQVYMRGTRDGGVTWGTESRISDGLGYQPVAADPCLIVDPSSGAVPGTEVVYCVMDDWRGYAPGGRYPNVYSSRSNNGGATWSVGVQVNDITEAFQQVSSHALVLLGDGGLTAGWLNNLVGVNEFRTSVSGNQGATWGASVRVNQSSAGGTGTWSSIVGLGNDVYAGYDLYESDWNSYFRPSSDGGRTWTDDPARMDDDNTGAATGNTVLAAVSAEEVCGAWQDTRPGYGPWLIYTSKGTQPSTAVEGGNPVQSLAGGGGGLAISCAPNPSTVGQPVLIRLVPLGGATTRPSGTRVVISDAGGRWLRSLSLVDGRISWDGHDASGRSVPPGFYWVRPAAGGPATKMIRVN